MADEHVSQPLESVHSPTVSAHISHAVIASYAAAAAREVAGVAGIPDGHAGLRDRRAGDPDRAPRGVRVTSEGEAIALQVQLVLAYGADIAATAAEVERAVREFLRAMIDLDVDDLQIAIAGVVDGDGT